MPNARPDFHNLPLTIQSPAPKKLLRAVGLSLVVLVVGLLVLFIPPERWMNITGILLSLIAIWMVWDNSRYKTIQIDEKMVRVVERQWPRKQKEWEEPISAFKGVMFKTFGLNRRTATFVVQLIHPDEQKTLELYSADGAPRSGLLGTTDAEWEENESVAIESAFNVGRILNLPVLDEQRDCT